MRKILLLLVGVFALLGCEKDNPITNEFPKNLVGTAWGGELVDNSGNVVGTDSIYFRDDKKFKVYSFFSFSSYRKEKVIFFSYSGDYEYSDGKINMSGAFDLKQGKILVDTIILSKKEKKEYKISEFPKIASLVSSIRNEGVISLDVKNINVSHQSFTAGGIKYTKSLRKRHYFDVIYLDRK